MFFIYFIRFPFKFKCIFNLNPFFHQAVEAEEMEAAAKEMRLWGVAVDADQEAESQIRWQHRGAGIHGDRGGHRRRRGSNAVEAIAWQRQLISMVEAAGGEGGNSGMGVLSDVFSSTSTLIIKNKILSTCIFYY